MVFSSEVDVLLQVVRASFVRNVGTASDERDLSAKDTAPLDVQNRFVAFRSGIRPKYCK